MKKTYPLAGLLIALLFATSQAAIPTDGIVAHYPLNGNGNDTVGSNHMVFIRIPTGLRTLESDATYISNATYGANRFGNPTGAMVLDGNYSYARSQNIIPSAINNNFSMSLWVLGKSTNPLNTNTRLLWPTHGLVNYGGGNAGVGLTMKYGQVILEGHSHNYIPTFVTKDVAPNVWHQLVVTCANSIISLYVDGNLVGSSDQMNSGYNLHPSSGDPYAQGEFFVPQGGGLGGAIGYNLNTGYVESSDGFAGSVSDFRIYNRGLSATEAAALYAAESVNTPPPPDCATQLAALQRQLAAADDLVVSLQTQLAAANTSISELRDNKTALEQQIITLNGSLSTANANLTQQVASLQTQATAANATITQLTTANTNLTQQVAGLQTQFSAATAQLTNANALLLASNAQLSAANAQLSAIKATVVSLGLNLGIASKKPSFVIPGSTLAQQISNLAVAIAKLEKDCQKDLFENLGGVKHDDDKESKDH